MRYLLLFLTFCFLANGTVFSQDKSGVQFGKVSAKDFELPVSGIIDSNTKAVIIADIGSVDFVGSKYRNWVSYVYRRHLRIKIIDKKAFDLATIKISLWGSGTSQDQLDSLQGTTYNLDNGKLVETKLSMSDVFEDRISKNRLEKKFSMPALKEGSIIEYSYAITSARDDRVPAWSFQHFNCPCLHSEFEMTIPSMLSYLMIYHGQDSFLVNKTEKVKDREYKMASVNVSTAATKHRWVMKNIPEFREENFINSPGDYIDKMEFHLSQVYNGSDIKDLSNSWKSATEQLLEGEDFGYALDKDIGSFLLKDVKKVTTNDKDIKSQVKSIYYYVRDNYTCTDDDDIYVQTSLANICTKKKGSAAEINIVLIAMLRQNGVTAEPVILGTKEYGSNPPQYPVLDKINHVICMTRLSGDTVYLDASDPQMGFGRLPIDCYNGHARIVSLKDSGSVFFDPDLIRESKMTTVFISNSEKGKISGTYERVPGFFGSDEIRREIAKTGITKFFENIKKDIGSEVKISNTGIDSLKQFDFPVRMYYDFAFPIDDNSGMIYFNPIIGESNTKNPFAAEERKYPVEMPYPIDDMYVLNMEIPDGYMVEELPKSAKVAFNGNEGFFEYLIAKDETNIQLRTHIKLNRATFFADEYNALRDFFSYVVKKYDEQIVFKKKK